VIRTHATATPTTLLFRFSASTGNAHRIHDDRPYATRVERYPDLMVHGPLLAIYMANLVRSQAGDRVLTAFAFRFLRPVFLGDTFRVDAAPDGTSVDVAVVSGESTVHATATADFA
jgi:3-methylfumaryl-CoA hydratase